jgi:hypothetical protein
MGVTGVVGALSVEELPPQPAIKNSGKSIIERILLIFMAL